MDKEAMKEPVASTPAAPARDGLIGAWAGDRLARQLLRESAAWLEARRLGLRKKERGDLPFQ